ncbi:cobalamin biosynthesis protein CobG [Primorskyibacter flagellatus]|uniref:Precorrin-3B synthase n=1 Tax=Primorskyibacter flagellatus TaxID=1387277 RepID=A0A1W2DP36_9RHOB|nr:cobalamin biosynthesis protein CobG [Primorskyibacter flagellatus]SMC99250.1 precorrin-3B synthase [Primorskyibacter flagellatus]
MTTPPTVKGWCPGAYRPMLSADGLVMRVRPRLARLTPDQGAGLCDIALRYGSGSIDLTNRANLQIRGVAEADHDTVLAGLGALGLLDKDPRIEERRNILVAPFWTKGDLTARLTRALLDCLADLPELPAKVGFAVDCDPAGPQLARCSADIRIEQGQSGLILRADGAACGRAVTVATAIPALIEMAVWLADHVTPQARRMALVSARDILPEDWSNAPPRATAAQAEIGLHPLGALVGAPFGQIDARALKGVLKGATGLRLTPWRTFLLEGVGLPDATAFITAPDDPLMRVDACPGAPVCPSASVETRDLARALAPRMQGSLHVSGCSKGCARARPADVTLIGRNGAFDLVRAGCAEDLPLTTGLHPDDLMTEGF